MKNLIFLIFFLPVTLFSQTLKLSDDLTVVHFNANWNSANDVEWVGQLTIVI